MFTSIIHQFRAALQRRYPNVLLQGDASRREIALTFDDGPHPRDTPQVLEALAKHDIIATFFLIGQNAELYPQLVKQIHQTGHQLALHCYRHVPFPLENASKLKRQLDRSRNAIANTCDISAETIRDVRPPYGFFNAKTLALLNEWGYQLVLWDNMPLHFIQPVQWSIKQTLARTVPGSIIILHDGKGHGSKAAAIVDTIIPKLKSMEYDFVRIEDMKRNRSHEQ